MLSDEQDAEVARIRERWSNGPTKRYPEATEAADQRDIESLLAMLDAARAAERALVERIEASSERPEPEAMSNAEGEAWDLLHDDSNIICTCDGCNFYSPTYDDRAECSLNIYIEDIVLARVRFATRTALRPEAATTEGAVVATCQHHVKPGSYCAGCAIHDETPAEVIARRLAARGEGEPT